MAKKKPTKLKAPEACPVCGEDVQRGSLACPECGADHNSGWREDSDVYDAVDLPDEDFNYEEFIRAEFGVSSEASRDKKLLVDCRYRSHCCFYRHLFLRGPLNTERAASLRFAILPIFPRRTAIASVAFSGRFAAESFSILPNWFGSADDRAMQLFKPIPPVSQYGLHGKRA